MAPPPRLLIAPLVALLLAGCTGASPSPSPQPSPPDGLAFFLRVTTVQALPPSATFGWLPSIVVTRDGRVLTPGAVDAMYPGPLVSPVVERRITAAGWNAIVAAAREAGLLSGASDFTGGGAAPGSALVRLQLFADGRLLELTGDPSRQIQCIAAPCVAPPGTPEAFAGFVARLYDLGSWLGAELGPEALSLPNGYALIVGPPPAEEPPLSPEPVEWPLAAGFAGFGKPLADGSGSRCGIVRGADVVTIRPLLDAARSLARWRDPVDGTLHGLTVRPLIAGDEDPCVALV
jgi:hypothetical protein